MWPITCHNEILQEVDQMEMTTSITTLQTDHQSQSFALHDRINNTLKNKRSSPAKTYNTVQKKMLHIYI